MRSWNRNRLEPSEQYDAWAQGTRFELPIFIFQGENDLLTSATQAQSYFADIEAPLKHTELVSDAEYFAPFSEPEQFLAKFIGQVRPLAYTLEVGRLRGELISETNRPNRFAF